LGVFLIKRLRLKKRRGKRRGEREKGISSLLSRRADVLRGTICGLPVQKKKKKQGNDRPAGIIVQAREEVLKERSEEDPFFHRPENWKRKGGGKGGKKVCVRNAWQDFFRARGREKTKAAVFFRLSFSAPIFIARSSKGKRRGEGKKVGTERSPGVSQFKSLRSVALKRKGKKKKEIDEKETPTRVPWNMSTSMNRRPSFSWKKAGAMNARRRPRKKRRRKNPVFGVGPLGRAPRKKREKMTPVRCTRLRSPNIFYRKGRKEMSAPPKGRGGGEKGATASRELPSRRFFCLETLGKKGKGAKGTRTGVPRPRPYIVNQDYINRAPGKGKRGGEEKTRVDSLPLKHIFQGGRLRLSCKEEERKETPQGRWKGSRCDNFLNRPSSSSPS